VADAVLIYADSFRSADMRHAVPLGVPDPFLYAEENGSRHVFASSMEATRIRELGLFDVHVHEELGFDELIASGIDSRELNAQLALRAVGSLGLKRASVPQDFPVWLADRLRADGVDLAVDQDLFDDRRRAKTEAQLAGMRRAQRAAEAAMDACRELLRRAEIRGEELLLDGEPLTVERVKADMSVAFARHDTTADEYIVAPGAQGAVGHDMGSGPIRPGTPLVVDIFPRDNASAVYTDMTRTFVVGDVPDDVAQSSTSPARSSKPRASRRNARSSPARRSPTASSTGSDTGSASRCTRRRGWGGSPTRSSSPETSSRSSPASIAPATAECVWRTSFS
jgi:Xaa-Pro aminopeptidase